MADRVVLLNRGRIEQNATPAELYERPANDVRRALHRHAADESAAARARRGRRRRSRAPRARRSRRPIARGSRSACGPSTSRSRSSAACAARSPRSSISAPIRSSTCRLGAATLAARVPGSVGARARRRRPGFRGRAARSTSSSATARAAPIASRHETATHVRLKIPILPFLKEEPMIMKFIVRARRGCSPSLRSSRARARAGAGRGFVLLPGRRRRTDHQDHRRLRRRFREGESRHQGQADLFGHATRTRSPRR